MHIAKKIKYFSASLCLSAFIFMLFASSANAQTTTPIPEVSCATWDTQQTWVDASSYKDGKYTMITVMEGDAGLTALKKAGKAKLVNKSAAITEKIHACLRGTDLTSQTIDEGTTPGIDAGTLRTTTVRFVQYVLGFLAIIGVIMVVYGGIIWITSAGSEEKVTKARKIIIAAAIGLVIIAVAWTIVSFVINTAKDQII